VPITGLIGFDSLFKDIRQAPASASAAWNTSGFYKFIKHGFGLLFGERFTLVIGSSYPFFLNPIA
jgi:hypothetical protein